MGTQRYEMEAWLGPAAEELTDDQMDVLLAVSDAVAARFPDEDLADDREAALTAATQLVLGEDSLAGVAGEYLVARAVERHRWAGLTGALIAARLVDSPNSERALAEVAGVTRMTVRKALGR